MKLVLVDNLVMPETHELDLLDVHPHLGLLSLAAVVSAHGHEVEILDPKRALRSGELSYDAELYERFAARVLAERPGAVGFTTLGCSFLFALNVARVLRRSEPELPILLGGPHATMLSREILERFDCFDVVVRHEAEPTIADVLAQLPQRSFHAIEGITWRSSTGVRATAGAPRVEDLDALPLLDYDLYPVESLKLDLMRVEAGRGCPFACTFCSTARFFQRKYRIKSPGRLVDELDRLHARYGAREFKLDHDLFTVDRRKVAAFCEAVADRGYRWRVSARVDCVDDTLLSQMAAAGCIGLYFGIETGSTRMQKITQKNLDLALVEPRLDTARKLGIEATVSYIAGYPEEQRVDLDATLNALGNAFRRPPETCLAQLHLLSPEPGTPLFAQHAERMRYDGHATHFNAWVLGPDDRGLVQQHRDVFASYHYYPAELPRELHTFAVDGVDLLRRAGSRAIATAMDALGCDLATWIDALWQHRSHGGAQSLDSTLVVDYLSQRLGPEHLLCSWFRYAFAAHPRVGPNGERNTPIAAWQSAQHARAFEPERV